MGNDQYNFQWAMINWVASRTLTNPRTHEPVNVVDDTFNTTPLFWALYSWFEEPVASDDRYYEVAARLMAAGSTVNPKWGEHEKLRADAKMRRVLGLATS